MACSPRLRPQTPIPSNVDAIMSGFLLRLFCWIATTWVHFVLAGLFAGATFMVAMSQYASVDEMGQWLPVTCLGAVGFFITGLMSASIRHTILSTPPEAHDVDPA